MSGLATSTKSFCASHPMIDADRLSRSVQHLINLGADLRAAGINLTVPARGSRRSWWPGLDGAMPYR